MVNTYLIELNLHEQKIIITHSLHKFNYLPRKRLKALCANFCLYEPYMSWAKLIPVMMMTLFRFSPVQD